MPDPVLGERACAFVIPKEDEVLSLEELTQFLEKKNVAKFKWPERLEILSEFPLLPNGKIDKRALEGEIAQMLRMEGKIA
jgi:2,3-dihydroxybenzoate-AMP ligase